MPDSASDPLSALRRSVTKELAAILTEYQRSPSILGRLPLRFRPDGKGGELATPLPMAVHLEAELLADALNQSNLPLFATPSDGWLAMNLTGKWEEDVRRFHPAFSALVCAVPSPPAFPARIDPLLWRLDVLSGIYDPSVAARQDRGNPAFRVYWVGTQHPCNGVSRRLVNECALLYAAISGTNAAQTARQMIALADAYLAAPAEGNLVQKALCAGWRALEI